MPQISTLNHSLPMQNIVKVNPTEEGHPAALRKFCTIIFINVNFTILFSVVYGTFQKEFNIPHSGEERNISISLNCEDVYGHSIFINEVKFERQRSRRDDLKRLFGERCNNRTTCAIDIGHPDWSIFVYYKCKFVSLL